MSETSIFVVPRSSRAWRGNEAGWITTAGWAAAGQQLWGDALVATTDGVFSPAECVLFPRSNGSLNTVDLNRFRTLRKIVPEFLITAYKDWRLMRSKPSIWPIENSDRLKGKIVRMVWERHDLFPGIGRKLADKYNVPLVTSVEAPAVWEAARWGVRRPLWGKLLEKHVEAASLKRSDLVSCVSEEVREKVISMGVPADKVIVSHNRVDSSIFNPDVDGGGIAAKFGLRGKRVIGWTGSFRGFHALDNVVDAFRIVHDTHSDTVLMLVGDGLEFEKIKAHIERLGLTESVILPGRQPVTKVPSYLKNFEIGLVTAPAAAGFHYSPLKLREYLATGLAVVAPRAGNLSLHFKDNEDVLFYQPGNAENLARKIIKLLESPELQASMRRNAKAQFEKEGTWLHELETVCRKLNIGF